MKKAQCPFLRGGEACLGGGVSGEFSDPRVVGPYPALKHNDVFVSKAMSSHAEGQFGNKLRVD